MKFFFYKSFIIFILFLIGFHFTFGVIKKEIKNEIIHFTSKENIEKIKKKIREEIKNGSNKESILNETDVRLLKAYYNKLKKDFENIKRVPAIKLSRSYEVNSLGTESHNTKKCKTLGWELVKNTEINVKTTIHYFKNDY